MFVAKQAIDLGALSLLVLKPLIRVDVALGCFRGGAFGYEGIPECSFRAVSGVAKATAFYGNI